MWAARTPVREPSQRFERIVNMTTHDPAPASTLRLRSYVVWSYVVLFAAAPFFAFITLTRLDGDLWENWLASNYLVSTCVLALLAATSSQRILAYALDGTPPLPAWLLPLMGLIGVQASISAAMIDKSSNVEFAVVSTAVVLPLLMVGICLSLLVSTRTNYRIAAGVVAVAALHQAVQDIDMAATHVGAWITRIVVVAVSVGIMAFGLAASYQWTMEVLRGVDSQSKIDAMRGELAAAEERLRIARDLHDVFGRTLTAVAVKSELAAALAEAAGAQKAADESRSIHDLADDALKEVRSVLAEYRRPEFSTEVAGAHSLLSAAGIHVRLIGTDSLELRTTTPPADAHPTGDTPTNDTPAAGNPAGALSSDVRATDYAARANEAFALVVREAGTNIVRHSDAQQATFRLVNNGHTLSLTVTNDGVTPVNDDSDLTPGSGLDSLAARLQPLGGHVHWQHKGTQFVLTAQMPITASPTEPDTRRNA